MTNTPFEKKKKKPLYSSFLSTLTLNNRRTIEDQRQKLNLYCEFLKNKIPTKIQDLYVVLETGKTETSLHLHCMIHLKKPQTMGNAKNTYLFNWIEKNINSLDYDAPSSVQEYLHHKQRRKHCFKLANNIPYLIDEYMSKEENHEVLFTTFSNLQMEQFKVDSTKWKEKNKEKAPSKHKTLDKIKFRNIMFKEIDKLLATPLKIQNEVLLNEDNPSTLIGLNPIEEKITFSKKLFIRAIKTIKKDYFIGSNVLDNLSKIYKAFLLYYSTEEEQIDDLLEDLLEFC